MQAITNAEELRNAIQLLEAEQAVKQQLLKEQFSITYESLKPINILRRTVKEISSSPDLIDNLLGTSMGIASGFITKKLFVGTSDSTIKRLFGSLLQMGVAKLVTSNSEAIRSFIQLIFKYLLSGKRTIEESDESYEHIAS
jgi:hypothetical protein